MPPNATQHPKGFKQKYEKGVVKSDLHFKETTAWWRMNLKGGKTGHARGMKGPKAVRAGNGEERTNSTTVSGNNQRTLLMIIHKR